jgi:pheromone a factor receptor
LISCNIIHGINSVIWFGNQTEHAPVWCDISRVFDQGLNSILIFSTASVVLLGAMVAVPACFLCIARRLEVITTFRGSEPRQAKTFEAVFEAATCFLLPALYMGLRESH